MLSSKVKNFVFRVSLFSAFILISLSLLSTGYADFKRSGSGSSSVYGVFQFSIDSAVDMVSATTWMWQNTLGDVVTIDSIYVDSSNDNYSLIFLERNSNGGGVHSVDTVTAVNNGVDTYYVTETVITHPVIEPFHWIGFSKPTSEGDRVYIRIHYHK